MIEYNIETEDSSIHWKYLKPAGKNVLDLGCGRWCDRNGSWDNLDPAEFSPIWLGAQGARKVVGVDSSVNEINIMNDLTKGKAEVFTFIYQSITSPEQLKHLINLFDINVIKSDIERAETNFFHFTKEDFSKIEAFAVEYHEHYIKDMFLAKLPEWGFNITVHGKLWVDGFGVLFAEK